jgi:hypothetical protein
MTSDALNLFKLGGAINFSVTEGVLWNIYTLFFVFYVFMSLIFVYHWHRYEGTGSFLFLGEVIYFIGSIVLMVVAGMAVAAF